MKKVIYFFSVILMAGFLNQVKAQPEITFQWFIGCDGNAVPFSSTNTILEGDTTIFEGATLEGENAILQPFVDALVGSEFFFEPGSFPVDPSVPITINCFFADLNCGTGFFNDDFIAFNAILTVMEDNVEQPSPYWFGGSESDDQVAVIRIPDSPQWQAWMTLVGLDLDSLEFVYLDDNGNTIDDGIEYYYDDTGATNYHTVEMRHFSNVAGGDKSILTDVEDEVNGFTPEEFALEQNYPNPFNPSTTIRYALPERSFVELKVYNILGVEVASLVNSSQDAGVHSISFDASNLTSGVYIYQIKTEKFTESRKMLLMK